MPQRRLEISLLLVVTCLLAAQARAQDDLSRADHEAARKAWMLYTDLRAGNDRLRAVLGDAQEFLREKGKDLGAQTWDRAHELLHRATTTRAIDEQVREARRELPDVLARIRQAVLAVAPQVFAYDQPNDKGTELVVNWKPAPAADHYEIERREMPRQGKPEGTPWHVIADDVKPGTFLYEDDDKIFVGHRYNYRVYAVDSSAERTLLGETGAVRARPNWYNRNLFYFMWFMIVLCGAVVIYIWLAGRGVELKIRKIAGLEAVDEAVGRATEMGRPILFIPGIQDMNDIQTVAGIVVLGRVANVAAEHDARLEVPTSRSLVMTAARETVHASYLNVGRPDAYEEKQIYYVTDEQFGYVAAVTGVMVRHKPATCFYMGAFFAESLILAETANAVGSIQIAGTAMPAQLPFFVAACDYTLIGEEFFAASAYLSGEPNQLGSLKGQDVGKFIVMLVVVVGVILATLVEVLDARQTFIGDLLRVIRDKMLEVRL